MYPSASASQTGARKQQGRDEGGPSNHGHDLAKAILSKSLIAKK